MIELKPLNQQRHEYRDDELVCFCFDYTRHDIETDCQEHGRSTIMERITLEKKRDGCNCSTKNPKGS